MAASIPQYDDSPTEIPPRTEVLSPDSQLAAEDLFFDNAGSGPLVNPESGAGGLDLKDGLCGRARRWMRPSIWWLLPFIMLFTTGYGGVAVPRINLILSLVCRDYFATRSREDPGFTFLPVVLGADNPQCRIPEVQSLVARFQLAMNLIVGLLSSITSPQLGHLSDRYGRTRFIALGALCTVLNGVIIVSVVSWHEYLSKSVLFIGSALEGLGGSFTTTMALFQSYGSDCTRFEDRGMAFGLFQGALFFGLAVGPTLAALLIKETGNMLVIFYIAIAFHTIFILALLFVVPESLSKERQRAAREKHEIQSLALDRSKISWWKTLNPLRILAPLSILWPAVGRPSPLFPNPHGASVALRRNLVLMAAIDTTLFGIAMGAVEVIVIYAGFVLNWSTVQTSLFASTTSIVRVTALFVVLPLVTRFSPTRTLSKKTIPGSEISEINIIRTSIIFDIAGFIGYVLARHSSSMVASGVLTSLGAMASPTLQSALSKHVPQDRIGRLLGTTGLLHALARVVAPTIMGFIYSVTVGTFPQAVFVCLASFLVLAFFASLLIRPHVSFEDESIPDSDIESSDELEGEAENEPLLSI